MTVQHILIFFFYTCNNVMFYHNQSETSEFTTPIGYIMILKSSINPQHIKNKMNILEALFCFFVMFSKSLHPSACL